MKQISDISYMTFHINWSGFNLVLEWLIAIILSIILIIAYSFNWKKYRLRFLKPTYKASFQFDLGLLKYYWSCDWPIAPNSPPEVKELRTWPWSPSGMNYGVSGDSCLSISKEYQIANIFSKDYCFRQEVIFFVVLVCLFVCLSVCLYPTKWWRIFIKLLPEVCLVPRNNQLNFGLRFGSRIWITIDLQIFSSFVSEAKEQSIKFWWWAGLRSGSAFRSNTQSTWITLQRRIPWRQWPPKSAQQNVRATIY